MAGRGGDRLAKCSMDLKDGLGGGGFVVLGGRSFRESKRAWEEVELVLAKERSKGGGVDFGVRKSLLSEIPEVVIGESGVETFGLDGEAVW
ncbi:hypothetical protein Tco_1105741 [Tanacetum coccineum]